MPISIAEFKKLDEAKSQGGGRKVNWNHVSTQITQSGQYYTVKEVHDLIEAAVTPFRVKGALDKLVQKGILERRWDGKRFWYGDKI